MTIEPFNIINFKDMAYLRRLNAEDRLIDFIELLWHTAEPAREFVRGWAIEAVCLDGDSTLLTNYGPMAIRDIVDGRLNVEILSFNHASGKVEFRKIKNWMRSSGRSMLEIRLVSGRRIVCTHDHPVYVEGRGYVRADSVDAGSELLCLPGVLDGISGEKQTQTILLDRVQKKSRPSRGENDCVLGVQKKLFSLTFSGAWRNVQHAMFRGKEKETRNADMPKVRRGEIVGRKIMPRLRIGRPSLNARRLLSTMRERCENWSRSMGSICSAVWSILRKKMLWFVYSRLSSCFLYGTPTEVFGGFPGSATGGAEARRKEVLSVLGGWDYGCASRRREQAKQRTMEFGQLVPGLPQQTTQTSGRGDERFDCVSDFVAEIVRGIRIPEHVYNVEVEGNNNYFANEILLHNCEHLEAVTGGDIKRLIINVPPGFLKSMATCVFWPAWEWGPCEMPYNRYICTSYSSSLTERDNLRTLQVVHSPLFKEHWGDRFKANESMVKIMTDKTGWKLATSVGGVGTGERGDRVIVDDPNSVRQAESKIIRESTNSWMKEVMPTRLNDPRSSAIVLIQQRTHEEDVTGFLLSEGGDYEHLMIPMEWDGRRYTTSIGWTDPRTVEDISPDEPKEYWNVKGELAFPERFPLEVVERDKKIMGSFATAAQFQQMPVPRGGGIIKMDWWQRWGADDPKGLKFPPFDTVVAFYDGAYTVKEQNDPSAMAVLGTFMDNYPNPDPLWSGRLTGTPKVMLAQCWASRLALTDAVAKIDETCRKYKVSILLVENKANGHSVYQELHRLFRDKPYSVILSDPGSRDKVARAMSVAPLFENEMIYAPNTEWAIAAQNECATFPKGAHDDRVDAIVGALLWMRENNLLKREGEFISEERQLDYDEEEGRQTPLYWT